MSSLDKMLSKSAPDSLRQTSLVNPVMAKIKQRKARAKLVNRALVGCLVIGLLALLAALIKGNTFDVVNLAVHKVSSLQAHPGLYARALLETLPWPLIGTVAGIALLARIMQRNKVAITRHATAAMSVAAGAMLVTASASAATIVTTDSQPGPVQQQLERTVNGIGKQQVTINGHTYDFSPGLTDEQILGQVEMAEFARLNKELNVATGGSDGGTLGCMCKVTAISPTSISFGPYIDTPGTLPFNPDTYTLTGQTIYLVGATKVPKYELLVGDLVVVAPNVDLKTAAYVAKLDLSYDAYFYAGGFSTVAAAHRSDGKCYNNEADKCPNIPAVQELFNTAQYDILPDDAVVREVFGQMISFDADNVKVKTSSGAVWTFSAGDSITAHNQAGYTSIYSNKPNRDFQIKPGDYLRIEFWQHKKDLAKREVISQAFKGTNGEARELALQGKLDLHPETYIRAVQVALQKPWNYEGIPLKFKP